jgi:DNA-binding phage protein
LAIIKTKIESWATILIKSEKMIQYRDFRDYHIEKLRDPEDARIFLSVILEAYEEDGDIEAFLLALKDVTEAQGGFDKIAKHTKLSQQDIHNFFADKDNPRFDILEAILQALGFHLSIEPIKIEIEQYETININSR